MLSIRNARPVAGAPLTVELAAPGSHQQPKDGLHHRRPAKHVAVAVGPDLTRSGREQRRGCRRECLLGRADDLAEVLVQVLATVNLNRSPEVMKR